MRPTENFEPLAASFKRIQNILKQANFDGRRWIDTAACSKPARKRSCIDSVRQQPSAATTRPLWKRSPTLRPHVDLFFDKVLVNAPDPNDPRRIG